MFKGPFVSTEEAIAKVNRGENLKSLQSFPVEAVKKILSLLL